MKGHVIFHLRATINPERVDASAFFCEGPPFVTFSVDAVAGRYTNAALGLQPAEARRIAAELIAAAEKAEG